MSNFFGRKIFVSIGDNNSPNEAIRVGGIDSDFRIDFDIEKTRSSKSQNKSNIRIYNLDPSTRSIANLDYDRIILEFGYEGINEGQTFTLFNGKISKVTHSRQSTDIISIFECIDGGFAYSNTPISKSYPSSSSDKDIVRDIAASMDGISIGDLSGLDLSSANTPNRERVVFGSGMDEIEVIARNNQARATVNNGVLDIISNNSAKESKYIPFLNYESGLLGSPSITEKVVEFKALIQRGLEPNNFVVIEDTFLGLGRQTKPSKVKPGGKVKEVSGKESPAPNPIAKIQENSGGVFRINQVKYSGSTHSNNCEANCSAQFSDGFEVFRPVNDISPVTKV